MQRSSLFSVAIPVFLAAMSLAPSLAAQTVIPATVTELGSSCGNPVPHLAVTGATLGSVATVCVDSDFPGNPATMNGHWFVFVSFPPPLPYPVYPPSFPGFGDCTVYVDLSNLIFVATGMADAQGDFCVNFPIANDPTLLGLPLNVQARLWAFGGPFEGGDHLSNGIQLTIGNNLVFGTGRTPGFWKQSQHFQYWPAPYTPNTLFSSVFDNAFPGKTLLQVLRQGGGGLNALGRHTVAALLNSASGNVNFALEPSMVITLFNGTVPGSAAPIETLKNYLAAFNETEGGIFP